MPLRLFSCPTCGYRMRLAGDHCGHCHNPKPVTRTAPFFGFMILVAVLAVSLSVLSWAIFAFSHAT